MCAQMEVLKKIRKAGKMNGFATELAEAQAEDFMSFRSKTHKWIWWLNISTAQQNKNAKTVSFGRSCVQR